MLDLPPGQAFTRHLWQVGETSSTHTGDLDQWQLIVEGAVGNVQVLSARELLSWPSEEVLMDVHCVTGWSCPAARFTGVPLANLLEHAKPASNAQFVRFEAYSARHHDTSLPLDVVRQNCWAAFQFNGEPLPADRGGPVRLLTRGKYFYKSLKWLHRIELCTEDVLGYWERESGYHNEADPWKEQRFDPACVATDEQTMAFRGAEAFHTLRETVLIRANLSGWRPQSADLRRLRMKACRFDNADLSAVDLRGANLTLSNFFRANLSSADLTGADIEGAKFVGADLTGARLLDVNVSATTFYQLLANGQWKGPASVDGVVIRPARGSALLEDQERQLRNAGVSVLSPLDA